MTTQPTLFELGGQETVAEARAAEATARRTDPASSHAAAAEMNASGAAKRQREAVVDLVFLHPGRTSKELAKLSDLDRYQIARRLPEAEKAGQVERREDGSRECTWWPKD